MKKLKFLVPALALLAGFMIIAGCSSTSSDDDDDNGGPVAVTGVSLSPAALNLERGGSATISAELIPATATNRETEWAVEPTSGVITLTGTGTSRTINVPETAAVGATATITVTTADGPFTATAVITVVDAIPVTSLTITPATLNLTTGGGTGTLSVTSEPAEASDNVGWTSSNTDVATVSATGVVTAVNPGTATITARSTVTTTVTATATVNVTVGGTGPVANPVTHIDIWNATRFPNPESSNLFTFPGSSGGFSSPHAVGSVIEGQTIQIGLQLSPVANPPSVLDVTWRALNEDIARLESPSRTGATVRGMSTGTARFSVSSVSNPEITLFFSVTVDPGAFVSNLAVAPAATSGFINPGSISGTPAGTFGQPYILEAGRTATVTITLTSDRAYLPMNLGVYTAVEGLGGVSVNTTTNPPEHAPGSAGTGGSNTTTTIVATITASSSTSPLTGAAEAAKITFISSQVFAQQDIIYVRVIQRVNSIPTFSRTNLRSPALPLNDDITITASAGIPVADIATWTWANHTTNPPVVFSSALNVATLRSPAAEDDSTTPIIGLTVIDHFGNTRSNEITGGILFQ